MLFAHSIFRNLAVTFGVPLLSGGGGGGGGGGGATALWYDGGWFFGRPMLVVCPSHVFKGKPRSICSVNFFRQK